MWNTEEKSWKDFDWAFGLNRLSLRLMGVWPDSSKNPEESKTSFFSATNLRVPFMILSMLLFLLLPQIYALVLVINELPLVIDNLMTSSAVFTSSIKIYFLWRSKTVLEPVVRSVTKDWLRSKHKWELQAMTREAARARLFTLSGYLVLAGCYVGFAVGPIIGVNVRMISNITDYGDRYLFVQSYFPYDYSGSPNYELTLLSQFIAGLFVGMSVSIPDNYFTALVLHACAEFEILGVQMETSIGESMEESKPSFDAAFQKKLGAFVNRHVHLMRNIAAVERSFSFIIAAQVFCMTVMVCCLGFQILSMFGGSDNRPPLLQVVTLVSTLFTLMMHTLVDCLACEILATRSTGIFHCIYKSDWYKMDRRRARDLIPVMLASRFPQTLTAGKIFDLSLATYCNILKSSAGYISMLIAVNGK